MAMLTNKSTYTRDTAHMDMECLYQIFGEDPLIVKAFINVFITSTLELLNELDKAIQSKGPQLSHHFLHRLKGSASSVGMRSLYELCDKADTEANVAEVNWSEMASLHSSIFEVVEQLKLEVCDLV